MKRIVGAYRAKFRALLSRVGARRVEKGIDWAMAHSRRGAVSPALEAAYQIMRRRAAGYLARRAGVPGRPPEFVCDVGLGGLARWLRGAGYMAYWREGAGDVELIAEAAQHGAILLTTDSGMMERRVLRDGKLPALWLSPGLTKMEQLQSVLVDLDLPLLPPRCMQCGGELDRVAKADVAERIPPKTLVWRDEYFVCRNCGKLFWHGTHWRRIVERLQESTGNPRS